MTSCTDSTDRIEEHRKRRRARTVESISNLDSKVVDGLSQWPRVTATRSCLLQTLALLIPGVSGEITGPSASLLIWNMHLSPWPTSFAVTFLTRGLTIQNWNDYLTHYTTFTLNLSYWTERFVEGGVFLGEKWAHPLVFRTNWTA